jgi:heptosyltransferase I
VPRRFDVLTLRNCKPRRICILKPSALGDVVQSLPVLPALRARWPQADVTWVIRDDLSELVEGHPSIDEWLPFARRGGVLAFARLLRRLKSRRFDLVIDLQGLARTAVMSLAAGAPLRVGLETSREGAGLAHNIVLPGTGRDVPAYARYRRLSDIIAPHAITAEGARNISVLPPALNGTRGRRAVAAPPAKSADGSRDTPLLLAVHPGGKWPSKRWPVGRFAAVIARAVREWNSRVVVLGGATERERNRSLVASLRAAVPACDVEDLTGATSLARLAAVLRDADVLLSSDSGPLHLAAALGTPVVGVYTSTSPHLSGPAPCASHDGPRHQLVAAPTPCAGCYRRQCPHPQPTTNACQRDLTVERVWQALQECVDQNQQIGAEALPADRAPSPCSPRFIRPAASAPAIRRPA